MPYIDFEQLVSLEADCLASPTLTWHSAGRSHVGKVRQVNEDAFYSSTEQAVWAVADGMGGHARGDYAAAVVAEAFVHFAPAKTLALSIRDLETRLCEAHKLCQGTFPGEPVGAAVAALFIYRGYSFLLWAGDSRIYRLRGADFQQLTTDHTVAQEKYRRGELTAAQAETHRTAHVLTRAVGVHQTLYLEIDYAPVQPGDRFLICSDGLYKHLSVAEIQQYLEQGTLEEARDALINRALDKGGSDNITVIVVAADSLSN